MKIRTRLAIRFTLIVATLLALFACSIYFFTSSYHEKEFYARLEEKANNYAQLLVELDEVNPGLVRIFDKNTAYLPNERILIYNEKNQQLFNTNEEKVKIQADLLEEIRREKKISYSEGNNQVFATTFPDENREIVVIVSASNVDNLNKLNNLKLILVIGFFICIVVTMIAGWIFAGKALKPISGVVEQVENITVASLTERVSAGNYNDEIGQLAITFNRMLERIQKSFELQKSFVSNSSHELRTPLTAITGQLEVALMNKRNPEEYKEVLSSVLEDIKSVNRLTNGLLELAHAEMDKSKLRMKNIRVDELLWLTRADILKRSPEYLINIEMQGFPEDEKRLTIFGSEHLLRSAFINIIDNACKFSSNHQVNIQLKVEDKTMDILFQDEGIGISEEEISKIAQPFFRGINAKTYPGHGLGLSLTYKIVEIHNGEMNISSRVNKYTEVRIRFKNLS